LPGKSANPGGMSRGVGEVKRLAQQHGPEMIDALVAIVRDKKAPHVARVAAAREVLDRGFGRPEQSVSVDVELARKKISELSLDEIREMKARIASATIEAVAVEVAVDDVGGGGAEEQPTPLVVDVGGDQDGE
jgi:hypothetical protein